MCATYTSQMRAIYTSHMCVYMVRYLACPIESESERKKKRETESVYMVRYLARPIFLKCQFLSCVCMCACVCVLLPFIPAAKKYS